MEKREGPPLALTVDTSRNVDIEASLVPVRSRINIIVIGDAAVGKTTFIAHATKEERVMGNTVATVGANLDILHVIDPQPTGGLIRLEVWDTAGQERFAPLTASYLRKADAVVLMFDVTNAQSYESILGRWTRALLEAVAGKLNPASPTLASIDASRAPTQALIDAFRNMHLPMVLVGNKTDLPNALISPQEATAMATSLGAQYMACSAGKDTRKVLTAVFDHLVVYVLQHPVLQHVIKWNDTRDLRVPTAKGGRAANTGHRATPAPVLRPSRVITLTPAPDPSPTSPRTTPRTSASSAATATPSKALPAQPLPPHGRPVAIRSLQPAGLVVNGVRHHPLAKASDATAPSTDSSGCCS